MFYEKIQKNSQEGTTDFYANEILHSLMTRPKDFELTLMLESSEGIIDKFLSNTQLDRYNEDFMDKRADDTKAEQNSQLELDYIKNKHIIEQIMVNISVGLDLLIHKRNSYINERNSLANELEEVNTMLGCEKYA